MELRVFSITIFFLALLVSISVGKKLKKKAKQELHNHIIIDYDDAFFKVGYAGDHEPISIFPAIVGRPRHQTMSDATVKQYYVGNEADENRKTLIIKHPIERGLIVSYVYFEAILSHIFSSILQVNPQEHNILIIVDPLSLVFERRKITEVLFESFNVRGVLVLNKAILNIFAHGRSTGINIDIGSGITNIIAVKDYEPIPESRARVYVSYWEVLGTMAQQLAEEGYIFTAYEAIKVIPDIIAKTTYVAEDYKEELVKANSFAELNKIYKMPDGTELKIRSQRFRSTEIFFNPAIIGEEFPGIHQEVYNSIMKCNVNDQAILFANIILTGRGSMFRGIEVRLTKELTNLGQNRLKVIAASERENAAWIGGSTFASINKNWFTIQQYYEQGPSGIDNY